METDILSGMPPKPEGVYSSVITEDGYLVLPTECLKDEFHNDDGSPSFILTNSMKVGRLCLYSSDAFDDVKHEINGFSEFEGVHRRLRRLIVGEAVEVRVDEESRIKIDPLLLLRFGLDPELSTAPDRSFPFHVMLLMYQGKIEILSYSEWELMA